MARPLREEGDSENEDKDGTSSEAEQDNLAFTTL